MAQENNKTFEGFEDDLKIEDEDEDEDALD